MKKAKLFKNGQSQAVRLPREFRFMGKEVYVRKVGKGVLLMPTDRPWESLRQSLNEFSEDFMGERNQPSPQKRDEFE